MGGGPRPPKVDIMTVAYAGDSTTLLEGQNTNQGYPVTILRTGESSYFQGAKRFKVTFEPIPSVPDAPPK
jgi:hypothetical protein